MIVFIQRGDRYVQIRVVQWHIKIDLASCLCGEIDGQVAIDRGGMVVYILNILDAHEGR